jgi:hypothetical protein
MLGELLQCGLVAQRMRGSAHVRGMRYLYTVLHWVSQRREEQVCAAQGAGAHRQGTRGAVLQIAHALGASAGRTVASRHACTKN